MSMINDLIDDSENSIQGNYPVTNDVPFTPDEIEAIQKFKAGLQKKINKNASIARGLETASWGLISYSICRILILTSGSAGIGLAIASAIIINNIVNRDLLEKFNANKTADGLEVEGMGSILKFMFSSVVAGVVVWNGIGDFVSMSNSSKQTYEALNSKVEDFNRLPDNSKNLWYVVGGLLTIGGVMTVAERSRR